STPAVSHSRELQCPEPQKEKQQDPRHTHTHGAVATKALLQKSVVRGLRGVSIFGATVSSRWIIRPFKHFPRKRLWRGKVAGTNFCGFFPGQYAVVQKDTRHCHILVLAPGVACTAPISSNVKV
ncbi:hypothetical protein TcCL_NonESM05665, partial [Trypanosoma cruzi]